MNDDSCKYIREGCQVYDQYDLMNDFISLGIHRVWKKNLINMMNPSPNKRLVDVACGTGDIAQLYLKKSNINFLSLLVCGHWQEICKIPQKTLKNPLILHNADNIFLSSS